MQLKKESKTDLRFLTQMQATRYVGLYVKNMKLRNEILEVIPDH